MEAKASEVEKLNLNHLPVELRKELLEAMERDMAQHADDPEALKVYLIGIKNLLASLD